MSKLPSFHLMTREAEDQLSSISLSQHKLNLKTLRELTDWTVRTNKRDNNVDAY